MRALIIRISLLFTLICLFGIYNFQNNVSPGFNGSIENSLIDKKGNNIGVKKSESFTANFVYIKNDNWSETSFKWIIPNSGTWDDPHIIENVSIDGGNSRNCILIENSHQFFKIRNCCVYNAPIGNNPNYMGGIKLINTANGTIINNNCSNNRVGIVLYNNCKNNTIINNIVVDNSNTGIYVYNCPENRILNNTMGTLDTSDQSFGMYIRYAINSIISNNTIVKNNMVGLYLDNSDDNIIQNNSVFYNEVGILIVDSESDSFSDNTMLDNGFHFNGDVISEFNSHLISNNNSVNGKPTHYYADKKDLDTNNFTNGGQIMLVSCSNSKISNLNVSRATTGIYLYDCENVSIQNIEANNGAYYGIILNHCNNNTISNCSANYNGDYGFYSYSSDENVFFNNTAIRNGRGFQFSYSDSNNLTKNIAKYNNNGGVRLDNSHRNIINNNTFGNDYTGYQNIGLYLYRSNENIILNNTANYNSNYGISIYNCYDNNITENDLSNNYQQGLYMYTNSYDNLISNNTIVNNKQYGIYFKTSCTNNIVLNNTIINNVECGICFEASNYNTIFENRIFNNNKSGIALELLSNNNLISKNIVQNNNQSGLFLDGSKHNIVSFNNFSNVFSSRQISGIDLENGCENNSIKNNFLYDSQYGIFLNLNCINNSFIGNNIFNTTNSGVFIDDTTCENNIFYLNYFNSNVAHATDNGNNNLWNNASIGNYWDDYDGIDENLDGIGDAPREILGSALNYDFLPIWGAGVNYPGSFSLWSNAGNPENIMIFSLFWSASSDSDNFSVYVSNSFITGIHDLTLLKCDLETNSLPIQVYAAGDYYFVVISYNEIGFRTSNCIHVHVEEETSENTKEEDSTPEEKEEPLFLDVLTEDMIIIGAGILFIFIIVLSIGVLRALHNNNKLIKMLTRDKIERSTASEQFSRTSAQNKQAPLPSTAKSSIQKKETPNKPTK